MRFPLSAPNPPLPIPAGGATPVRAVSRIRNVATDATAPASPATNPKPQAGARASKPGRPEHRRTGERRTRQQRHAESFPALLETRSEERRSHRRRSDDHGSVPIDETV